MQRRSKWVLGRVVKTFPDKSGVVRTVSVKTSSSVITRPVAKLCLILEFHKETGRRRRLFEGHPLQARHKQNWGRGFILLLPQTAALPGSDAGSDVVKPASSFVIQNRQTACSMWCPMYGARC